MTADHGGPTGGHPYGYGWARGLPPDLRGYAPPEQPPKTGTGTHAHDEEVAPVFPRRREDFGSRVAGPQHPSRPDRRGRRHQSVQPGLDLVPVDTPAVELGNGRYVHDNQFATRCPRQCAGHLEAVASRLGEVRRMDDGPGSDPVARAGIAPGCLDGLSQPRRDHPENGARGLALHLPGDASRQQAAQP